MDEMFEELNITQDLKIVRLVKKIESTEYSYNDLKKLVEECDNLYPGIDLWFRKKVKSGLISGERTALVAYYNNNPIAAVILRKGANAKLCSMRILPEQQSKGLGSLMIALIAAEIRNESSKIHFTIPENLWNEKSLFFQEYGFIKDGLADIQYRLFESEFKCSADFQYLWKMVLHKLPATIERFTLNSNSSNYDLVISIKPKFATKIKLGSKRIEIRRRFSRKWKGASAMLYASHPVHEFFGEARIKDILCDKPQMLWEEWKNEIGCSFDDFTNYCNGSEKVYALILDEIKTFKIPVLLSQMQYLVQQTLTPPQSHCEVKKETVWPIALSLSCLLRGAPLGSTRYL